MDNNNPTQPNPNPIQPKTEEQPVTPFQDSPISFIQADSSSPSTAPLMGTDKEIPTNQDNTPKDEPDSGNLNMPPIISTSAKPKGKKGGLIATVLVVLFLVVAVGAGVFLVQKPQDIREKADETEESEIVLVRMDEDEQHLMQPTEMTKTSNFTRPDESNYIIIKAYWRWSGMKNQNQNNEKHQVITPLGTVDCNDYGNEELVGGCPSGICTQEDKILCGTLEGEYTSDTLEITHKFTGNTVTKGSHLSNVEVEWYKPYVPEVYTPPQCLEVKVYNNTTEWKVLTSTDLANLKVGETAVFAVSGTSGSGSDETGSPAKIDKAMFDVLAINDSEVNVGVVGPEITDKKPGTEEFYWVYTIPDGAVSLKVKAKLHDTVYGWF